MKENSSHPALFFSAFMRKDNPETALDTDCSGFPRRPRFMLARENMTLGLCSLPAEHLLHCLEDPSTLYFRQRFSQQFQEQKRKRGIPAGPKQEVTEELFLPKG